MSDDRINDMLSRWIDNVDAKMDKILENQHKMSLDIADVKRDAESNTKVLEDNIENDNRYNRRVEQNERTIEEHGEILESHSDSIKNHETRITELETPKKAIKLIYKVGFWLSGISAAGYGIIKIIEQLAAYF